MRRTVAALTALLAAIAGIAVGAPAVSAAVPEVAFATSSYGTYVTSSNTLLTSGATNVSAISCTHELGLTRTNSGAGISLPLLAKTGTISTRAASSGSSTVRTTTAMSTTAGVHLLTGVVRASAIRTDATATVRASGYSGTNGATFAGLRVAGQAIAAHVSPNTTIAIKVDKTTVASVTLNAQTRKMINGRWTVRTQGLVLRVLPGNPYGIVGGTTVVVGSSTASFVPAARALLGGSGEAARVTLANGTVTSGPHALAGVACDGGDRTSKAANANVPGLLSTGAVQTTTHATNSTGRAQCQVVVTVANPRVLGSLITASAVTAKATAIRAANGRITTADGSAFAALKVAGHPAINGNVKPNTKVDVAGLGTVTLHKVTRTARSIDIVMVEVQLAKAIGGLPTGSMVRIGRATASIRN